MRIPPEVMAIPVIDIPPTDVCLACKADRRSEAIRDLVATALATLAAGGHEPPRGYLRMPLPRRPTSATTACPARQTRLMPSAAAPASLAAQPLGPQGRVRVHYGLVEEEMLLPGTIAELQQRLIPARHIYRRMLGLLAVVTTSIASHISVASTLRCVLSGMTRSYRALPDIRASVKTMMSPILRQVVGRA